ncbi:hypothetical protein BDQ17DRAFT_541918 [Cyathus striatus]|nr:hypothetical protein BDQ17DRAFT_541918 [Cyathus striatus]
MLWVKGLQLDYFMTSYAFPVWVQYFKSYKNDALVKQLVIMSSFNTWRDTAMSPRYIMYMHRLVQDAGHITNPDADQAARLLLHVIQLSRRSGKDIENFLFYSEYSGPFHCTQDEYAGAFCHMLTASRRVYDIDHLNVFLEEWTEVLKWSVHESRLFNMEHPLLLKKTYA